MKLMKLTKQEIRLYLTGFSIVIGGSIAQASTKDFGSLHDYAYTYNNSGTKKVSEWTEPVMPVLEETNVSKVESGKSYFIKNVGSGQFLTGSNSWSTQISLTSDGVNDDYSPALIIFVADSTANINNSQVSGFSMRLDGTFTVNGNKGKRSFTNTYLFREDQNSGFIDHDSQNRGYIWKITKTEYGYFRIQTADGDPTYPNSKTEFAGWDSSQNSTAVLFDCVDGLEIHNIDWFFIDATSYQIQLDIYNARKCLYETLISTLNLSYTIDTSAATLVYNDPDATKDELEAATAVIQGEINRNYLLSVLGGASDAHPIDATQYVLVNPNFETGDINGWTTNYVSGQQVNKMGYQGASYTNGDVTISKFFDVWKNDSNPWTIGDGYFQQTIYGLPEGKYALEVDAISHYQWVNYNAEGSKGKNPVEGVSLFIQSGQNTFTTALSTGNNKPEHFSINFTHDGSNILTLGLKTENATANWIAVDNFSLRCFHISILIDGIYYYLYDKEATVTFLSENSLDNANVYRGDVVIPSSIKYNGNTYKVTGIDNYAFSGCSGLTSIVVPPSVTTIGKTIFRGCFNLEKIIYLSDLDDNGGSNAKVYNYNNLPETILLNDNRIVYNGNVPNLVLNNELPIKMGSTFDESMLKKDVGTHIVNLPLVYDDGKTSIDFEMPYSYTINPKTINVKVKDAYRRYGEPDPQFESTYSGFVNGEDESIITSFGTYTTTANPKSDVGSYTIKQSGVTAKNYVFEYEDGTLDVNKTPLIVSANNKNMNYGDDVPALDLSYEGLKNNESVPVWVKEPVISTSANSSSKVGIYPITIIDAEAKNYELSFRAGNLTVNKAALIVSPVNQNRFYGDENPSFELNYIGLKNGEIEPTWETAPVVETTATKESAIGEYPIRITKAVAVNYELTLEAGTLTIDKAPLIITPQNTTREYGEDNPQFGLSYSGLKNGETVPEWISDPIFSTTASAISPVGEYDIKIVSADAKNYAIERLTGKLRITKAPLIVSANDTSMKYGDQVPSFDLSYEGLKNNETSPVWNAMPEVVTTATSVSPVGIYPIVINSAEAKNYELTFKEGRLTVEKADLTVKAVNKNRLYGDENPEFTLSFVGLKNDELAPEWEKKPLIETSATITSDVGQYPITVSNGSAVNYNLTYESGTLIIEKAPLKLTPKDVSRKYGEDNPYFTLAYSGLRNNELEPVWVNNPVLTTSASKVSPVGSYEIKVESAEAKNYTIESRVGTLTITKATLEISVKNCARMYGAINPSFEMSYIGLVNGENAPEWIVRPTITTEATTMSGVGEYAITASNGEMKNYETQSIAPGILTITSAPLSISANDVSILYYSSIPELTYKCIGFMGTDDEGVLTKKPIIQTSATKTSIAGSYPIEVSGAEAKNYDISYESGTLIIEKRRLTVSTKDYTRTYGEDNPEFDIMYSGFVNDEDESVLQSKPQITTPATKDSDAGVYPIIIADGSAENYYLSYIAGQLTVEKAYQTIHWDQDFSTVNQYEQIELTAKASSGLEVSYLIEGDAICSIEKIGNTYYLDCFGTGEAVLVAIQEGNKNYWQSTKIYKTIKIFPTAVRDLIDGINGVQAIYDANGRKLSKLQHGVNILLMSDGTKRKVIVK